jgi:glucose-6-phosphate isomerase
MQGLQARPMEDRPVLEVHKQRLLQSRITDLIEAGGAARNSQLRLRVGPLYADFSRSLLDIDALNALRARLHAESVPAAMMALLAGERVNTTEDRAVLHALLRTPMRSVPSRLHGEAKAVAEARQRLTHWVDQLNAQGFADGSRLRHVVNVGIGGSDLGPRLVLEALPASADRPQVHFLSSVDGHALDRLIGKLNPAETLVVLVSKSFSTRETLMHGAALRQWLEAQLGAERARSRLFAVTTRVAAAVQFGIPEAQVLPIWDWVGGRYSVWSAVSFAVALRLGMAQFDEFLAGGNEMDEHFHSAPVEQNLPLLAALVGYWNRTVLGYSSLCVVPYDPRLRELPHYLQQLEMESNGKSVRLDGTPVHGATVPVIWGGVGTDVQHAFFQALHQGTEVVPVDFIGIVRPDHPHDAHHHALLANLLAQSAALASGTPWEEGADQHRHHPGNRPNTVYLLDALTPGSLGALIALYEHKVFAQSRLWGINAFDQWGVELGKKMANALETALVAGEMPHDGDAATLSLITEIRSRI